MQRAQREHGSDLTVIISDYDGPVFGYASMNFYSEFLAAVEVYDTYANYFGELVLESPAAPVRVGGLQAGACSRRKGQAGCSSGKVPGEARGHAVGSCAAFRDLDPLVDGAEQSQRVCDLCGSDAAGEVEPLNASWLQRSLLSLHCYLQDLNAVRFSGFNCSRCAACSLWRIRIHLRRAA